MVINPLNFSIIIPTLNEEKALPILLHDLSEQTYPHFEIIIVDGFSQDKTKTKVEQFIEKNPHLPISFYQVEKHNVSFQRNFGALHARNEWIIFMDADNQLPNFFLQGITYQLEKNANKVDLFSTLVHLSSADNRKPFYRTIAQGINLFLAARYKSSQPLSFGAMIGIRRAIFPKIRFNEESKVMEDSLFVKKARQLGYKFKLFSEPTFAYSMRRIKGRGLFRTAGSSFMMQMRYIFGDEFTDRDYGYKMLGGQAYEKKSPS